MFIISKPGVVAEAALIIFILFYCLKIKMYECWILLSMVSSAFDPLFSLFTFETFVIVFPIDDYIFILRNVIHTPLNVNLN